MYIYFFFLSILLCILYPRHIAIMQPLIYRNNISASVAIIYNLCCADVGSFVCAPSFLPPAIMGCQSSLAQGAHSGTSHPSWSRLLGLSRVSSGHVAKKTPGGYPLFIRVTPVFSPGERLPCGVCVRYPLLGTTLAFSGITFSLGWHNVPFRLVLA